jgi:hypothetical protein
MRFYKTCLQPGIPQGCGSLQQRSRPMRDQRLLLYQLPALASPSERAKLRDTPGAAAFDAQLRHPATSPSMRRTPFDAKKFQ